MIRTLTKIVMGILKKIFWAGTVSMLLAACNSGEGSGSKERPNIIIIMADDLGYSDIGCYGGEIHTPNLDQLAAEGVRLTQMYNCARCCPTRASLMTGKYQHLVGLALNGRNLSQEVPTVAEILFENGYHTGMSGKWHLSRTEPVRPKEEQLKWLAHQVDHGPFAPLETYPCNRGFEEHWGVIWGVVDYFDPFSLVHNEEPIREVPDDFYMTDFVIEKSVELIGQFAGDEKPFFLYVAPTAPHWPLHALPGDIEKYEGTYDQGWEDLRKRRYERMLEMGLIDEEHYPLPPNSSGKPWDSCMQKEVEANHMEAHAAMVDRLDQGIGKIVEKLKLAGAYDNTVIFFLADNGASYERGYPPGFDRAGFTRDGTPIDYAPRRPGSELTWGYLGDAWASAANTPWRYWKKESFEGGIHTPFIVRWPAGLKGKENTLNHGVGHVMDILPTCLELAGADYPASFHDQAVTPPDGRSLLPLIHGEVTSAHDTLFWEHEGGRAVRTGDWKMSALDHQEWELFDLTADRTETNNLKEQFPERAEKMNALWEEWARRMKITETK
jgi:arylsulfatase A-like enzyme